MKKVSIQDDEPRFELVDESGNDGDDRTPEEVEADKQDGTDRIER